MFIAAAPNKAIERCAYDYSLIQQIAEDLKQARDPSVKKFTVADVAASTAAIIARCKPSNPK